MATYPTYGPTVTTNSSNMGGDLGEVGAQYSLLCMSCHDGASAVNTWIKTSVDGTLGSFINLNATAANLNETLADDHPVDFVYPTWAMGGANDDIKLSSDGGLTVVGTSTTVYPLYNKTMQCATCHNVHNGQSAGVQFMRGTTNIISESTICRDCHTSK
ncbi:MAG: cytochrome c3 family protein [Thermodesulfovibrionales bacterium]|nr:cytochrome c3 family protein [Thermodesulfovibrionales bacterium]